MSISLNGNPGSFIISLFFMGLGISLIVMGAKRLKRKKRRKRAGRIEYTGARRGGVGHDRTLTDGRGSISEFRSDGKYMK